ncbi:hypothetical protein HK405_014222 [Cladochytrium tenue]|nr:hypothetical protein HK405_014222 [Cladochytrium tenue]
MPTTITAFSVCYVPTQQTQRQQLHRAGTLARAALVGAAKSASLVVAQRLLFAVTLSLIFASCRLRSTASLLSAHSASSLLGPLAWAASSSPLQSVMPSLVLFSASAPLPSASMGFVADDGTPAADWRASSGASFWWAALRCPLPCLQDSTLRPHTCTQAAVGATLFRAAVSSAALSPLFRWLAVALVLLVPSTDLH